MAYQDWWGYIKKICNNYKSNVRELQELVEDEAYRDVAASPIGETVVEIIGGRRCEISVPNIGRQQGLTSDKVSNSGIKLADDEYIWQLSREIKAVEKAMDETEMMPDGKKRRDLIRNVLIDRRMTLYGAALNVPCSERAAKYWQASFIKLVAKNLNMRFKI